MRKLLAFGALLLFLAATASAQEGPRLEIFGGGSYTWYTQPSGVHLNMPGWTASADYYIFHWISAQIEGTGAYNRYGSYGGVTSPATIYAARLGPMIFPLGHRRLTPWVHFLFGAAYYDHSYPAYGGFPASSYTAVSYSWEGGAGLDLTIKKHWAVRLLQADYGQVSFAPGTGSSYGPKQSTYHAAIGVIYRFGGK
ncbi:MAG TPA: outer membrane beta-barrel protein [Candidatus Acidoferrales bacterium]|nr:outer membrane beta-barrel protein [Candidatus Acidoferrales bacterium]